MKILTPIEDRFWMKVQITPGCWEWTGYRMPSGHGQLGKGRKGEGLILTHVYSYMLRGGCLPPRLFVLHTCDNGWCVNPDHLYVGTKSQNLRDAWDRNRRASHNTIKTHCPRNHEYTEENTLRTKCGRRQCRTCNRERAASRRNS